MLSNLQLFCSVNVSTLSLLFVRNICEEFRRVRSKILLYLSHFTYGDRFVVIDQSSQLREVSTVSAAWTTPDVSLHFSQHKKSIFTSLHSPVLEWWKSYRLQKLLRIKDNPCQYLKILFQGLWKEYTLWLFLIGTYHLLDRILLTEV